MIPCLLPGVTFLVWGLLIQLGLDAGDTVVLFLVAEGIAMVTQALWVRYLLSERTGGGDPLE